MKSTKRNLIKTFAVKAFFLSMVCVLPMAAQTSEDKFALANLTFGQAMALTNQPNCKCYEVAREKFLTASSLYKENGEKFLEARALVEAGDISNKLGENTQALEYFTQALGIFLDLSNKYWEGMTLVYIGRIYSHLGEKQKALLSLNQSLTIFQTLSDKDKKAVVFIDIGVVYSSLGEKQKALTFFNQALFIFQLIRDESGKALAFHCIAGINYDLGRKKKAIKFYNRALRFYRTQNDKESEASTLTGIGAVYDGLDNKHKALKNFNEALSIFQEIGDKSGESTLLNNLGGIYFSLGEKLKALEYFQKSLILTREVNDKSGEAITLEWFRYYWEKLNNPTLAIFFGKQSVNIYQQLRANIRDLDKSTQITYLQSISRAYRRLADVLIAESRFAEAQAVLDLLKDEEYKELARSGETSDSVPYSKAEEATIKIIDNLATLGRRRSELEKTQTQKGNLSAAEQKELDAIYVGIEKANAELQKALEALKNAEPTAKEKLAEIESQQNLTATLEDLSKETGAGAVAIYTVVGTEDVKGADGKTNTKSKFGWVVLVTPKESKAYPIDVTELEETVFAFRAGLSSTVYNPEPLAKKLYDKIFRQKSPRFNSTLEDDLKKLFGNNDKIPTIMWSLDGVLRYVPMAALHDGKNYLVEKYRHIVFTKQSLTGLSKSDKKWSVLGLGVSEGGQGLDALPGVEKELKDIVCLSGETNCILNGTRRLNKEFTKEDTLRLWQRGEFPVIHIASHFSFNSVDQTASFLLIGDGRMNFADIQNKRGLFNNVDLLTLSACDTAMSANGKESESFAWLAQSLGAKTVLASLWKVSDAGTPELMIRFYKLRSENPQMPKAEAFRRAQLSLLGAEIKSPNTTTPRSGIFTLNGKKYELPLYEKDDKKPFAHPHFWSSFVLIGNWR